MTPSKFLAFAERRLGRPLTQPEIEALQRARDSVDTGKRDTVKAMQAALADIQRHGVPATGAESRSRSTGSPKADSSARSPES